MRAFASARDSLLELLYPETCAACGTVRGTAPWFPPGIIVSGLRPWDRPHMCLACAQELQGGPEPCCRILQGSLAVWSSDWTQSGLLAAVGLWKYHGVRGLAWPLAGLLTRPAQRAAAVGGRPARLVPVPLHPHRRRQRGFNQARILAGLLGAATGLPVDADLLRRERATRQQAKLAQDQDRTLNVTGAFRAAPADPDAADPTVGLVDDLVTSGATVAAAAAALRRAGWDVLWGVCLGLARPAEGQRGQGSGDTGSGDHVDTRRTAP